MREKRGKAPIDFSKVAFDVLGERFYALAVNQPPRTSAATCVSLRFMSGKTGAKAPKSFRLKPVL